MAQNRSAPAFQEYAANMLALAEYRMATLAERGLLGTMRNECWVNGRVPADPVKLAKYLGLTAEEVVTCLPGVMWMFLQSACGFHLTCPELDAYRHELDLRKQRMSEGGKAGAEKAKKKREAEAPTKLPHKAPQKGGHVVPMVGLSKEQNSPIQNSHVLMAADESAWVNDYEAASNGR
ncbi:hypothetical protein EIP75_22885 [Aquabacterium soli]|uniref:DUF1376 domain-containing protein n=1 Tax=Aquabacterium soli TaxID=2493092 RepID=A0A3R8T1P0_9BURK|nr:hypothetical protein [Aquabacterium soli]RRS00051.1 hypothetical protein EIP75_22885 [Aquabacterium soli]